MEKIQQNNLNLAAYGQWVRWHPLQEFTGNYILESIQDNAQTLDVVLINEDKANDSRICINFNDKVLAYRCTNESYQLNTMAILDLAYGSSFYKEWIFFKVSNSPFLSLVLENLPKNELPSHCPEHFVIGDTDSFMDFIADGEPTMTLIEDGKVVETLKPNDLATANITGKRSFLRKKNIALSGEHWIRWEPIPGLAPRYRLETLLGKIGHDSIVLVDIEDESRKLSLNFPCFPNTFRCRPISGEEAELRDWAFFKVENSAYVRWLEEEETYGIYAGWFQHYAFVAGGSIFEFLEKLEPVIQFIVNAEKKVQ